MSFTEVKNLRKDKKLSEALILAQSDLDKNKEDIWNKRSIGWVYYDLLKQAQTDNKIDEFLKQLTNIKELELPDTETMIFDSCAWIIGKFLFGKKEVSTFVLDAIFDSIKEFEFSKPKDSYSFLLKSFKRHSDKWSGFYNFTNWWGLDNFQPEDFHPFELENGKSINSLVETIYITISKHLLNEPVNIKEIQSFAPKMAALSAAYPKMQYPYYYYAKMLIALGDKEHFLTAFLPFAKRKSREFWVWNLMSENFETNTAEHFSCLCKAATCGGKDKFTGEIHEKLANVFISRKQYAEAKYELTKIIQSRSKEGWQLKEKHLNWQKLDWWDKTVAKKNNNNIYYSNITVAESLLFADVPEETAIIERVNEERSIINFVVSKNIWGFSSYKGFKIKPKAGDIFAVRFKTKNDKPSGFYKILSIRECTKDPVSGIYKDISGKLTIINGNNFGFLDSVFVSPQIIKENNLKNGMTLKGKALISFNKKKNIWGWNLIKTDGGK